MAVIAAAKSRPGVAVVGNAHRHQQRAEIGVAQAQRAEIVRVPGDLLGGIAGVIDDDLLRQNHRVDGMAERLHVEIAVRADELHQIQRRQIAGRIVQEHVLRAGIRGVDARGLLGSVPAVDGGIELHAGIAALMRGFGDLAHQLAGLVRRFTGWPVTTLRVHQSASSTTACMNSSVARTELLAFWKKMEP